MMNDKLDGLLKNWSEEKKPSDQHLHELTGQIRMEAAQNTYPSAAEDFGAVIPFFSKLSYAGLGAVAAVLIMMFVHSNIDSNGASALALISCDKADVSRKMFTEMREMFPKNLRWIAESNGDMNMGVETLAGGDTGGSEPMLVKVAVVARKHDSKEWKSVWNTDIILKGEELAEVMPSREHDNKIGLWVYSLADGKIAVDTDITLDIPIRLAVKKNLVMESGVPVELVTMQDEDVEYKVFQTVKVLNDDA